MHNKPEYLRTDNYYHLDNLKDGFHFEEYTAELLKALDFKNVKVLPMSNDYGADVLAEYNGVKYAIQCKYYTSQTVGVKSVQEILGGTAYHNADKPVVATNYKFSSNAIKLARANNVTLWDRNTYIEMKNTVGDKIIRIPHSELVTSDALTKKNDPIMTIKNKFYNISFGVLLIIGIYIIIFGWNGFISILYLVIGLIIAEILYWLFE